MEIVKKPFGSLSDGSEASLFTLKNSRGMQALITDYGCRIVSLFVPDRNGKLRDVVLGYDDIAGYEADTAFFGAVVGRHANRIEKGLFTLNGQEYHLAVNDGPNHLHGGLKGFQNYVWQPEILLDGLKFTHFSPDGDEGYPGNLTMTVIYRLGDNNALSIEYTAVSDKDTVFNTTNHAYFNLEGGDAPTVKGHILQLHADAYTEADENVLPTGVISPAAGTPFDFRAPKTIGQDIGAQHPQLKYTKTYDHNFVLNGTGFREAAVLRAPGSGITMTCSTDQPGLQVYVPAHSPAAGKGGKVYPAYGSVCLETQHFPNAMAHPAFPPVVLKAGEAFRSKTVYSFRTDL